MTPKMKRLRSYEEATKELKFLRPIHSGVQNGSFWASNSLITGSVPFDGPFSTAEGPDLRSMIESWAPGITSIVGSVCSAQRLREAAESVLADWTPDKNPAERFAQIKRSVAAPFVSLRFSNSGTAIRAAYRAFDLSVKIVMDWTPLTYCIQAPAQESSGDVHVHAYLLVLALRGVKPKESVGIAIRAGTADGPKPAMLRIQCPEHRRFYLMARGGDRPDA